MAVTEFRCPQFDMLLLLGKAQLFQAVLWTAHGGSHACTTLCEQLAPRRRHRSCISPPWISRACQFSAPVCLSAANVGSRGIFPFFLKVTWPCCHTWEYNCQHPLASMMPSRVTRFQPPRHPGFSPFLCPNVSLCYWFCLRSLLRQFHLLLLFPLTSSWNPTLKSTILSSGYIK